jgi:hypothetical protein
MALENVENDKTLSVLKKDIEKIYEAYILMENELTDENFKQFCDLISDVRSKYVS